MTETWRLFIALELPTDIRTTLGTLQNQLQRKVPPHTVRWTKPEGTHLTLKFLGEVPVTQRSTLEQALMQVAADHLPFSLQTGSLGCFPNTARPRVVWLGLQGNLNALVALRDAVEARIAPLGYPTENRPFSPHLTLGRVQPEAARTDVQHLGNLIATHLAPNLQTWSVSHVTLFRSELRPSGAVYTALCQAALRLP